jgi:hypothetical protein
MHYVSTRMTRRSGKQQVLLMNQIYSFASFITTCLVYNVNIKCGGSLGLTRELTDEVCKNEIGTSLPGEYVKGKLEDPEYSPH